MRLAQMTGQESVHDVGIYPWGFSMIPASEAWSGLVREGGLALVRRTKQIVKLTKELVKS